MDTEKQVLELIAADRIHIPISSMEGKLKRRKPKLAGAINLDAHEGSFQGERVYARLEPEDKLKARGTAEGIAKFCTEHPKYGEILQQMIEEERSEHENHLYFGTVPGARLTADDYMSVMTDLGLTESTARRLYPELMEISRNLSRKRAEERSILVG
jgi:hypothetical protein